MKPAWCTMSCSWMCLAFVLLCLSSCRYFLFVCFSCVCSCLCFVCVSFCVWREGDRKRGPPFFCWGVCFLCCSICFLVFLVLSCFKTPNKLTKTYAEAALAETLGNTRACEDGPVPHEPCPQRASRTSRQNFLFLSTILFCVFLLFL